MTHMFTVKKNVAGKKIEQKVVTLFKSHYSVNCIM